MAVTKTLKDNVTGKTYTFNFESEPTEQDLNEAVAHVQSIVSQQPKPPEPSYDQLVQSDADRLGVKSLESQKRDPGAINSVLAPVRQFTGTVSSMINQTLPYRALGKGIEYLGKGIGYVLPQGVKKELGNFAAGVKQGFDEYLSEPVKNAVGIAGDVLNVVPGSAGVEQLGRRAPAVVTGLIDKGTGRLASELSGVSEEALRKAGTGFGKGAKELKAAAGTQETIGHDLVQKIRNLDEYLPEKQVIKDAIQKIPDVNSNEIISNLQSRKVPENLSVADDIAANSKIDEWSAMILKNADANGVVPAQKLLDIRKRMDSKIEDAFGKESNDYMTALKMARHDIAQGLVKSAEESGVPEYSVAMKSMADKLQKVDALKDWLGKSAKTQDSRAQQFISTLFGKNKATRQRVVQDLSDIFGRDFIKESKLASLAAELGENGVPGLLPRQFTVRSALGPVLSGTLSTQFHNPAVWTLAALSSPRIAAGAVSGTGVLNRIGQGINSIGKPGRFNPSLRGLSRRVEKTIPDNLPNFPPWGTEGTGIPIQKTVDETLGKVSQGLRITPQRYSEIESGIAKEDAAKKMLSDAEQAAKDETNKIARGKKEAQIEQDIYMENLPKKPVISIDDLKRQQFLKNMKQGKDIKKSGNQPGDVASWHILGNEKGGIGGVPDFIGTPAIRDPKTGKVYTGNWRGHKDAIIKGENGDIQKRLQWEHFLDNTGKPTENVGFIDKNGNFISRAEAEKIISKPRSPVQMFHDEGLSNLKILGATGLGAAGGLAGYEYFKNRR